MGGADMASELDELNDMLAGSPFHLLLGLRVISLDLQNGALMMRLPRNPRIERSDGSGQHHGGVIASLIDIAGDFVLIWKLGHGVPTLNFRTDYLRPAINTDLVARAVVRKIGKTIGVCDVDVYDENEKLIAVGRGCYGTKQG